ncbi:hypothetical protein FRC01_001331, partial [Tulasnella sp. 417]
PSRRHGAHLDAIYLTPRIGLDLTPALSFQASPDSVRRDSDLSGRVGVKTVHPQFSRFFAQRGRAWELEKEGIGSRSGGDSTRETSEETEGPRSSSHPREFATIGALFDKPSALIRAERAQSLPGPPPKPVSRFLRSTPRSSVAPANQSHFKVPDTPSKVIRPRRRSSSTREASPAADSPLPALDFTGGEERRRTSSIERPPRTGSSLPGYDFTELEEPNGEPLWRLEDLEFQPPDRPSTDAGPSAQPQLTETIEHEPEVVQEAQEEPQEAGRPRRGRPRTRQRDAEDNAVKPLTTRQTKFGRRIVTQVIKRKPGRPRLDGGEFVTVIQDGVESVVRTRDLKRAAKKASRRPGTDDEESNADEEEDQSEDDAYQARGPTTRFRLPPAPPPVPRGPPGQVPQDVMAAYTSHAALLQSRTDSGLPQLYAAFQTFWVPRRANYFVLMGGAGSGLPYPAITAQGGGPGSSTAVHLSNPSFFYWDPLPLVPGGIRCPANECSNLLQHAGLVKQPKRVYMEGNTAVSNDPYVGFWIVAARYKCQNCGVRGTANPKVYSSYVAWDQKVLEGLPPLIRSEFPAVEKKKNGKKAFFAAEIALPPEHRMDPQFVSTMVPTQPQPLPQNFTSSAAAEPDGLSEAPVQPGPSHSTVPPDVGPIGEAHDVAGPSSLSRVASPQSILAQIQPPPASGGSRASEELGEAAGRLFAELLLAGGSEARAGGSEGAQGQSGAGMSRDVGAGQEPNGVSATTPGTANSLDAGLPVVEGGNAALPAGPPTADTLEQQPQAEEVDSTVDQGPSAADVERPAASSTSHPSGNSSTIVVQQHQPRADIPQPYYPGLDLSSSTLPLQPSPFQTPSSTPTPPVPSTSAAPGPVSSVLTGVQPYYAQFKAPAPQVTAPPSIHFFTPFAPPGGASATPGSAVAPSIPSWPPTLPLMQPGPSGTVVSSYSTLAGAVTPPANANHNHVSTILPVPVMGSFDAQSQVVVQVKKRRGRKCSKCAQLGCKGANGVQYCPNPCVGCKQAECKRPHTQRGNLCVEDGQSVSVPAELVPLEPSPSNSNSADGSGGPDVAQTDVHMHDAEGEPDHEPNSAGVFGMDDILV